MYGVGVPGSKCLAGSPAFDKSERIKCDMADLYTHIQGDHTPIQRIMMRLPGFRGYQISTDRRAADQLLRDHVVTGLKAQLAAFVEAQKAVLGGANGLSQMSKLHDI